MACAANMFGSEHPRTPAAPDSNQRRRVNRAHCCNEFGMAGTRGRGELAGTLTCIDLRLYRVADGPGNRKHPLIGCGRNRFAQILA